MKEIWKSFIASLFINSILCAATDSINISESIRDGATLVSSGGMFALGFFSPGQSRNRYLGIWYNNIPNQTVVWVANREAPLTNNTGVLTLTEAGTLNLLNETDGLIWSTNASRTVQNPTAQLLDSGNLVVKDADDDRPENFLWQSFDHPTDTYLPDMKMGWDLIRGEERHISSWRSKDDPAPGAFITHMDLSGYPQIFTEGVRGVRYRHGPWNGVQFSGIAYIGSDDETFRLALEMNKDQVMYWEHVMQLSVVSRVTLDPDGTGIRWTWNEGNQAWSIYNSFPIDSCDNYNKCGAYGSCNVAESPPCQCLDRFVPRDPGSWSRTDWSGGCVRRAPLNCRDDVFFKYSRQKMPDSRNSSVIGGRISLDECEAICSRNCSCVAYARLNISKEGGGCLFYYGDLLDTRTVPGLGVAEQDLYIRMSSTESGSGRKKRATILIASFASVAGIVLCLVIILLCCWNKRRKEGAGAGALNLSNGKEAELPLFSLSTVLKATNHFSMANKLGEGGFGPVYWHRNLVRLLGGCIEREENMLIYEYLPNSSLDQHIDIDTQQIKVLTPQYVNTDQTKSRLLNWEKRFNIINGIAKGILYLHQDSRLRIIHRDLKTSNILLDADMNPKISDFGLARTFAGNETEAKTRRVVGTYGYMSPEYAIDGVFSVKSDVFSFGVLVLEIVSGKRNRGFCLEDHDLNLLGHAWRLYKEDKTSQLVDSTSVGDSLDTKQALRSIHVALLCVQKRPEDRPSMSSVVFMLGNEIAIAEAKEPGFFTERDVGIAHKSNATNSENQVSMSLIQGR
ncbi:hypothetical protein SASPL_117988 [Salvia splendens]|uniref:Receptor-like serine/threonine-protein kinase n=1 Tax=Salvia splendens TaxID=180675 RepID=A0A8X8ZYQ5_SALSN|nr:hypothetical protein SASPL_117988 [Salvia splendens]